MKILIGCECSGRVRDEFIKAGHDAISCDLQDTEVPGPHIKGDILEAIKSQHFDLLIAHPECKYLCFSGERWINEQPLRFELRIKAFSFFKQIAESGINRICIENSHSVFLNSNYRKPNQTVHPYHFGDPYKKATCFWLKNLPPLYPTNILPIGHRHPSAWLEPPGKNQSKNRARTYPGIARAMAEQWGGLK